MANSGVVEYIDVATGQPYYFNPETGETSWKKDVWHNRTPSRSSSSSSRSMETPRLNAKPSAKAMARASRRQSQLKGPSSPQVFVDPVTGREYYLNPITGKTVWGRPTEISLSITASETKNNETKQRDETLSKTRKPVNLVINTREDNVESKMARQNRSSSLELLQSKPKRSTRPSSKLMARASHNLVSSKNQADSIRVFQRLNDQTTGSFYYYDKHTAETVWELPKSANGAQIWIEVLDSNTQRPYYVNSETNETSWTAPSIPHQDANKIQQQSIETQNVQSISNVFVARRQLSSAVIANATQDLKDILKNCAIEDQQAFRNALKEALALSEKYSRLDCQTVIQEAMELCPSPTHKRNKILIPHQNESSGVNGATSIETRQRSSSMKAMEQELERAIQVAIAAQTNQTLSSEAKLDVLNRAHNLGHDLIFTYSVTQIGSQVLRGLKEVKELISQLETQVGAAVLLDEGGARGIALTAGHQGTPGALPDVPAAGGGRAESPNAASLMSARHRSPTARTRGRAVAVATAKDCADFQVAGAGCQEANGMYFHAGSKQGVPFFTNEKGFMLCRAFVDLAEVQEVEMPSDSFVDKVQQGRRRTTMIRHVALKRSRAATVLAKCKRSLQHGDSPTFVAKQLNRHGSSNSNTCFVWVLRAPGQSGAVDAGQGALLYGANSMKRFPPTEGWEVYQDTLGNQGGNAMLGMPPAPSVTRIV